MNDDIYPTLEIEDIQQRLLRISWRTLEVLCRIFWALVRLTSWILVTAFKFLLFCGLLAMGGMVGCTKSSSPKVDLACQAHHYDAAQCAEFHRMFDTPSSIPQITMEMPGSGSFTPTNKTAHK
jgi:hypothetical protein